MPFLKKVQEKLGISNTTKGVYLGTPEAEGEIREGHGLLEFFEDYMHVIDDIATEKFIVTGRKGAGKSAVVRYLRENSSEEKELYSATVRPSDIDLVRAIHIISEEAGQYSQLYEWIVLTKFVKMLLETHDVQTTDEYRALERFQTKNSGLLNVDDWDTVNFEKEDSRLINFSALKSVFGAELGKTLKTTGIKAHFIKFIPTLREIVVKMLHFEGLNRFDFLVLFDDLDINFKLSRDDDKNRLLDLIRVTKLYNTEFLKGTKGKILIFIRDDVSDQLNGMAADKSKIFSSYETRLTWYDHLDIDHEDSTLLRKFINKRIKLAFDSLGQSYNVADPWVSFVENTPCREYNDNTAFKFILDFTFYLPRDLLLIFKDLEKKELPLPMKPSDVKILLKDYVRRKKEEIEDELTIQFDDKDSINQLMAALKELSNRNNYKMKDVLDQLNQFGLNENIFLVLIDYNLLIPKDCRKKLYYKYREMPVEGNLNDYVFTMPKCLYCYFHPEKI